MKFIKTLLFLAFLTSCNFNVKSEQKTNLEIETLNKKELESNRNIQGELIATIEFEVKANKEELKDFEDGVIPWISVEEIDRLIDVNKIVIPYSKITLQIDYPLNKPAKFILNSEKGFTKNNLLSKSVRHTI